MSKPAKPRQISSIRRICREIIEEVIIADNVSETAAETILEGEDSFKNEMIEKINFLILSAEEDVDVDLSDEYPGLESLQMG